MKEGKFEILDITNIIVDKGFNVYAPVSGELFDGLQETLSETGQLHPVIINRTADGDHLVAGEQRLRALMEVDADTIECKVFEDMTEIEKAEISVIENEQRRAPQPMDQARGMGRLRELGRNTKEIAELYGVSEDTVLRREKLLDLPQEVQKMIERDIHPLPIHQAVLLAHPKLDESARLQLARKIAPKTGPVMGEKDAAAMISDIVEGPKLPDPGPKQTAPKTPKAKTDPGSDASDNSCPAGGGSQPAPPSPAQKKNAQAAGTLKPVKGTMAVPGRIDVDADGQLVVSGVLTIKLDTGSKHPQLHVVKVVAMPIDIPADDTAAVIKMLKKCQPKAAKK